MISLSAGASRILAAASLPLAAALPPVGRPAALALASAGAAAEAGRRRADPLLRPAVLVDAPFAPSRYASREAEGVLRVTGWPTARGGRWRVPARILAHRDGASGDGLAPVRRGDGVLLSGAGDAPLPGARLAARWSRSPPRDPTVPDGFSERTFLGARDLAWRGRLQAAVPLPDDGPARCLALVGRVRARLRAAIDGAYPPREAGLLGAVLLGDRGGPRDPLRACFTRLGLAHLFAVSGLHVGILAAFAAAALKVLRCPPGPRTALTVGLLWAYAAVTGGAPSTVRAAAMATLLFSGRALGGVADPGHGLLLVFWGTQVWSPASLADPGLRLSFLAVGGILASLRAVSEPGAAAIRGGRLRDALAVSLGAQTGTAPAVATGFGFLAPWAPLINLAAVPLFGAAVWLAVLGLVLAPAPGAAAAPTTLAWLLLRALEGGAALLDAKLGTPPPVSTWGAARWIAAAAALLALRRSRPELRFAAVPLLLTLPWLAPPSPRGEMRAVQFDIGQGDAAALVFPDGRTVLIDTGPPWGEGGPLVRDALPWLRRQGVRRLAGVVLTHAHADHDGCAGQVAAAMPVDAWWLGGSCRPPAGSRAPARRPAAGDTLLAAAPWALVCLGGGDPDGDENDRSLAVALVRGGRPAGLWTGDQEAAGEAATLASGLLADGPWDLYKAGHHGSRTSGAPALLARVRPRTVLISCGVENRHGHPSHGPFTSGGDTFPVRRTDLEGTLIARWRGSGPPEIRGVRAPP